MTGFEITAGVAGTATGAVAVYAVIDPNAYNLATFFIGAVVTITTLVLAFKTAKLNALVKKVDEHEIKIEGVIKTSDGMKSEFVNATAIASRAEGLIAGIAQAEGKAALITAAKAEGKTAGIAQEKLAEENRQMTPPKYNDP